MPSLDDRDIADYHGIPEMEARLPIETDTFSRVGMIYNNNLIPKRPDVTAILRKTTQTYEDINGPKNTQQLLDSRPRPYPSPVDVTEESTLKHTIIGRQFEMLRKMYRVVKCDFCGFVKPVHDNPDFPTDVVFEWNHMLNKMNP